MELGPALVRDCSGQMAVADQPNHLQVLHRGDPADPRQHHSARFHSEPAGEPEPVRAAASLLEPRKSNPSAGLVTPPVVGVGAVQVPQGFLRSALGHFVQPDIARRALEPDQEPMQVDRRERLTAALPGLAARHRTRLRRRPRARRSSGNPPLDLGDDGGGACGEPVGVQDLVAEATTPASSRPTRLISTLRAAASMAAPALAGDADVAHQVGLAPSRMSWQARSPGRPSPRSAVGPPRRRAGRPGWRWRVWPPPRRSPWAGGRRRSPPGRPRRPGRRARAPRPGARSPHGARAA
jgi:hypothetical protein